MYHPIIVTFLAFLVFVTRCEVIFQYVTVPTDDEWNDLLSFDWTNDSRWGDFSNIDYQMAWNLSRGYQHNLYYRAYLSYSGESKSMTGTAVVEIHPNYPLASVLLTEGVNRSSNVTGTNSSKLPNNETLSAWIEKYPADWCSQKPSPTPSHLVIPGRGFRVPDTLLDAISRKISCTLSLNRSNVIIRTLYNISNNTKQLTNTTSRNHTTSAPPIATTANPTPAPTKNLEL
eukprot:PhF_6_TR17392/c0_g1_i2/m.26628